MYSVGCGVATLHHACCCTRPALGASSCGCCGFAAGNWQLVWRLLVHRFSRRSGETHVLALRMIACCLHLRSICLVTQATGCLQLVQFLIFVHDAVYPASVDCGAAVAQTVWCRHCESEGARCKHTSAVVLQLCKNVCERTNHTINGTHDKWLNWTIQLRVSTVR